MKIAEALATGPRLAAKFAALARPASMVAPLGFERPPVLKRRQRRRKLPQRGRRYKTEAEASAARRVWWQERARRRWAVIKAKRERHAASMRAAGFGVQMRRMKQRKPVTVAEIIARA